MRIGEAINDRVRVRHRINSRTSPRVRSAVRVMIDDLPVGPLDESVYLHLVLEHAIRRLR